MMVHIDRQTRENCWNLRDSYGQICVGCGCCSNDNITRYKARIECLKCWIEEENNFDNWIDGWREVQEKNRKANIKFFKRRLRYYERMLKIAEGVAYEKE